MLFSQRMQIERDFKAWAEQTRASHSVGNFIAWLETGLPQALSALDRIKDIGGRPK